MAWSFRGRGRACGRPTSGSGRSGRVVWWGGEEGAVLGALPLVDAVEPRLEGEGIADHQLAALAVVPAGEELAEHGADGTLDLAQADGELAAGQGAAGVAVVG